MTVRLLSAAFAMACYLSLPAAALAKGGHGGGHSSGGHGSGHASGGHASGHASGGHVSSHGSGAHARAGAASSGAPADTGTSSMHATAAATPAGRPHDGQPVIGTAVPRTGGPLVTPRFFYSPAFYSPFFYSPYRAGRFYGGLNGFGGLGLFYYDQFSSGYWPGGVGYPDYSYDYGAGNAYRGDLASPNNQPPPQAESGNLRLLIDPPAAQVYVDGVFVGTVEDAGSSLAGLRIGSGVHRLELTAPGYETLTVDVSIEANRTITYRGEMRRIPQ
jgi:hypothetical protein